MATETQTIDPVPQAETEQDEANITVSLALLQEMHVALRNLRETIPRVMDSVLVDPPAPEQLHLHFSHAARAAASDIKTFAQTMDNPRTKEVLEKAKESRAKNAEDITNWLVTEHEDWLDVRNDDLDKNVDTGERGTGAALPAADMRAEDIQSVLGKFRESHPGIEASLEESSRTVKMYLPPPAHIHFEIQPPSTDQGQGGFVVNSKEKTRLHKSILEAVVARPRLDDLELLLEMLASYTDIKSRPCSKCTRLLDRNAQIPVKRSKKRTKQADGQFVDHWEAVHSSCI